MSNKNNWFCAVIAKCRKEALEILSVGSGSTQSQRELAWLFLRQWGVK